MKVHLAAVDETELITLLPSRAAHSAHSLTNSPEDADLILFLGSFGTEPHRLLEHPLYRAHPDKCAVYTEDDNYLPLAPGVYCSARVDKHTRVGRVFSYSYASASGRYSNQFVTVADTQQDNLQPEKRYLFSFQGGSTSLLRKRLFNLRFDRPDCIIENTSTCYHRDLAQPGREERQRRYAETVAASHFVLCPRGAGTGSIRLFEVMQAGIAPVLLSDNYLLPQHVPWDRFLLRIAEKDIARLPELVEAHLQSAAERGRQAREAWLGYFSPEREFDAIVTLARAALRHGPPYEADYRRRNASIIARAERSRKLRSLARNAALGTLRMLRLKSPYEMNRE